MIQVLNTFNDKANNTDEFDYRINKLGLYEKKQIDIQIFGIGFSIDIIINSEFLFIDPATATSVDPNILRPNTTLPCGDEQKVYVRKPTSNSLATFITDNGLIDGFNNVEKGENKLENAKLSRINSIASSKRSFNPSASTPLLEQYSDDVDSVYHDLIPYTGVSFSKK